VTEPTPVLDARKAPIDDILEAAARVIFSGGVIIFPTDTVYGIGCDPFEIAAIERIFAAKGRDASKPLTFHLGTVVEYLEYTKGHQLGEYVGKRLLPGPVTLILPKPEWVNPVITGGMRTLGFRIPDDALSCAILDRCGPLATTSANESGRPAYRGEGDREPLPAVDLFIESGPTRYRRESSVLDLTTDPPRLLREGVLSYEDLTAKLALDIIPTFRESAR